MGVFVKICGMAHADDVVAVAAMKPDALGFVFWPRSPRAVRPEEVAVWTRDLPAGIKKVGVFVDDGLEAIRRAVQTAGLDVVQWQGFQALDERVAEFSNAWKAVRLTGPHAARPEPAGRVDAYLVDSYSAEAPGGTGQTVDWALAREFVRAAAKPVLLAGGLTPDNVAEAVRVVGPWGVDVCSGVELRPGRKDLAKARAFIERCRSL
jgi:phosphoribosylanthranilate isomerase